MSLQRLQMKRNFLETVFPAQVVGKSPRPQFPLDIQISWREYALDSSGEFFTPLSRKSGGTIEVPQFPATLICPPTCTLIASKLPDGTDVFGYQPCVHVMGGKITVETAARVGFTCSSMSFHICRGSVLTRPPLTNSEIVSSSNEVMNAKRNDAIMPPRRSGNVILVSVRHGEAPRLAAAWSSRSS